MSLDDISVSEGDVITTSSLCLDTSGEKRYAFWRVKRLLRGGRAQVQRLGTLEPDAPKESIYLSNEERDKVWKWTQRPRLDHTVNMRGTLYPSARAVSAKHCHHRGRQNLLHGLTPCRSIIK